MTAMKGTKNKRKAQEMLMIMLDLEDLDPRECNPRKEAKMAKEKEKLQS